MLMNVYSSVDSVIVELMQISNMMMIVLSGEHPRDGGDFGDGQHR